MLRTLCICAVLWLWAPGVLAEEVPQANGGEAIRLFLDCQRGCDGTYLRRELTFVSFVRDPADSDVHLLITRQSSASGSEYLLSFLGQGSFEGFGQALCVQEFLDCFFDAHRFSGLMFGMEIVSRGSPRQARQFPGPFLHYRSATVFAGAAAPGCTGQPPFWCERVSSAPRCCLCCNGRPAPVCLALD